MVPFAKERLGLDEAALGFILLALGGGSTVAMPLAGLAIHYWGSRRVVVCTALGMCARCRSWPWPRALSCSPSYCSRSVRRSARWMWR
jgi:predicted MFS family arabinose efflux permease